MTPAKIRQLCEDLGMDQSDLARGLSIPAATWYRYMKSPDGSGIPVETKNLLIAYESVVRQRKASSLEDQEIKDAIKASGVAGVVARAAMAGVLPHAIVLSLASNPLTSWIGAVVPFAGAVIGGIGALSGLTLFQKLKPKNSQKEKRRKSTMH